MSSLKNLRKKEKLRMKQENKVKYKMHVKHEECSEIDLN